MQFKWFLPLNYKDFPFLWNAYLKWYRLLNETLTEKRFHLNIVSSWIMMKQGQLPDLRQTGKFQGLTQATVAPSGKPGIFVVGKLGVVNKQTSLVCQVVA